MIPLTPTDVRPALQAKLAEVRPTLAALSRSTRERRLR
jgi:hypothetical protein